MDSNSFRKTQSSLRKPMAFGKKALFGDPPSNDKAELVGAGNLFVYL